LTKIEGKAETWAAEKYSALRKPPNEPLQLETSEIISQTFLRYTHAVDIKIYNIEDKE